MAEIEYAICSCNRKEDAQQGFINFLTGLKMVDFSSIDVMAYGHIRYYLKIQGCLIGGNDMLIAAQALAKNVVLVTKNVKEFSRVPSIKIENWVG
ncbi:MAG: type II toxin-antitoxin system VapC family toxin [Candidatus Riflebacteria bacterium]|nr:type II toxin-antitoxin system VapC family toxin [Candidatus Riflebacteria bacterium]